MNFLFWLCWVIDALLFIVCLYETFAVSSNKSWLLPAVLLGLILGASLWLRSYKPQWALIVAGLPAGLLLLFLLYFMVFAMSNDKWN
jgi:hypothetical protein